MPKSCAKREGAVRHLLARRTGSPQGARFFRHRHSVSSATAICSPRWAGHVGHRGGAGTGQGSGWLAGVACLLPSRLAKRLTPRGGR